MFSQNTDRYTRTKKPTFSHFTCCLLLSANITLANIDVKEDVVASAHCSGGLAVYRNNQVLFAYSFIGNWCSDCCGGKFNAKTQISSFGGGEVMCVSVHGLGRHDDLYSSFWFERSSFSKGYNFAAQSMFNSCEPAVFEALKAG